jgi:hypothetical protein
MHSTQKDTATGLVYLKSYVEHFHRSNIQFQAKYFNPALIEQLHSGAQTMLAYFHYCNKGHQPFALAHESNEVFTMAELDTEQLGFIRDIAKELKKRGRLDLTNSWSMFLMLISRQKIVFEL